MNRRNVLAATTLGAFAVPAALLPAPAGADPSTDGNCGLDWERVTWKVNNATYAAWNAHDPDAVAAVMDANVMTRESFETEWTVGAQAVRDRAAAIMSAFPDLQLERLRLDIDGPRHSDMWRFTGHQTGAYQGIPPTGRQVTVFGATFTTLGCNGLVATDVNFNDRYALLTQLGVIPTAG